MRKLFDGTGRRFVKLAAAVATPMPAFSSAFEKEARSQRKPKASTETVEYPRRFSGEHLSRIAFPLGGIGTRDLELGGGGTFDFQASVMMQELMN